VQASLDDPTIGEYDNVILVGGANDVKSGSFPTNAIFASNIDKSLGKLSTAAKEVPETNFVLAHQVPHHDADHPFDGDTDRLIRELYLLNRIKALTETEGNITAANVQYEADETGHPTGWGTVQILNKISDEFVSPFPLVWNPAFIIIDRAYRCVESIFRYGCNVCQGFGVDLQRVQYNNQLVCDTCYAALDPQENELLEEITRKVLDTTRESYESSFPQSKRLRTGGESEGREEQVQEEQVQVRERDENSDGGDGDDENMEI
jgi:hypothetical protein